MDVKAQTVRVLLKTTYEHYLFTLSFRAILKLIQDQNAHFFGLQNVSLQQIEDLHAELKDKYDWYGLGNCYFGQLREEEPITSGDLSPHIERNPNEYCGSFCPIFWRKNQDDLKTKFKVLRKSCFWLSSEPFKHGSKSWDAITARNVTYVQLQVEKSALEGDDDEDDEDNEAKNLWVFNTHFDQSATSRKRSVALIREVIAELTVTEEDDDKDEDEDEEELDEERDEDNHPIQDPCILLGNFNFTPQSRLFEHLASGKKKTVAGEQEPSDEEQLGELLQLKSTVTANTFIAPGNSVANTQIDYVFVDASIRVVTAKAIEDASAAIAKHVPLEVAIEL